MSQPFRITPPYDLLLRGSKQVPVGLYHLQLATAAQLTRLHYRPGTLKTVKARLKQLVTHGYLVADSVPTRLFRSPYYYHLTQKGFSYLHGLGMDTQDVSRPSAEGYRGSLFIDHSLELNDVLISAALLAKANADTYLDSFKHEQVLKRQPYKARLPNQRTFTIIPDAFLDFRVRQNGQLLKMPILLEHDRGTEQQQYFRRRIRAYVTFLKSGDYVKLFETQAVTVAFTTFEGERRREQLRAWTRAELQLTREPPDLGALFCFASLQRPPRSAIWLDPCWRSPYDEHVPQALLAA